MRYGYDLTADVVVESVYTVGVDEAVANPEAGLDRLSDLAQHVKRILNTILSYLEYFTDNDAYFDVFFYRPGKVMPYLSNEINRLVKVYLKFSTNAI